MGRYTFAKLNKLRHNGYIDNVANIKKIIYSASKACVGENDIIGIDLETNAIYYNVSIYDMGVEEPHKILTEEEKNMLLSMIYQCNVTGWELFYEDTEDISDGYGWMFAMEGEDGIIEKHRGCGRSKKLVTPAGFEEIEKILMNISTNYKSVE
jgi:hypothetical protein